jgi:AcrR family transcriptional regulator
MKISQEQKATNRQAIIRAAVAVVTEKGFKSSTMRQIAKVAGIGDATIYNYFTTKEAILFAYYEDHMQGCIQALKAVADFHTFTLQEQLQTLFETGLEQSLADHEFVAATFNRVLLRGSLDWARVKPIRSAFLAAVNDMLAAAVEVGEIPEPVFQELIGQFFMDAYIGVVHYWLSDASEGFANTSVIIDQGLDLACALLKAGIANKIFDITVFMFKNHVLNRLDRFVQPMEKMGKIKRQFMEGMDER